MKEKEQNQPSSFNHTFKRLKIQHITRTKFVRFGPFGLYMLLVKKGRKKKSKYIYIYIFVFLPTFWVSIYELFISTNVRSTVMTLYICACMSRPCAKLQEDDLATSIQPHSQGMSIYCQLANRRSKWKTLLCESLPNLIEDSSPVNFDTL